MDLQDLDMAKIIGGSATGAVAAVVHVLLAGLLVSPLMYGNLFCHLGAGGILGDIIIMIVIGGLMGALGAFVALNVKGS